MASPVRHTAALVTALGTALAGSAAHAVEYATVVSATPVTASVPQARQVCSDGRQLVQSGPTGAGAVVGAIAGGLIGHGVGGGFGRAAATGVGVVAGAAIGDQVEANASPVAEVPVRRCQTVSSYETRVIGYDVMYDYAGQRYSTRMARDPGKQLAVSVQPAEGASTLPTPAEGYREPTGAVPPRVYDYAPPQTVYYAPPQTVYYAPVPPAVYVAPLIGFGLGYYYGGGYRGGHRHWH
jgi:uncharacterized protein YcfJ